MRLYLQLYALLCLTWASLVAVCPAAELAKMHPARLLTVVEPVERPPVITALAVSANGKLIAAAGDDHKIRIWKGGLDTNPTELATHSDWVRGLAISPDGQLLASVGNDKALHVWNLATGEEVLKTTCQGPLCSVSWHPNGQQISTVGFKSPISIYNISSGDLVQTVECPCQDMRCLAFASSGEIMACAGRSGHLRLWNAIDGTELRTIEADKLRIRVVAFSPSNVRVATAGDGDQIHIWDVASGDEIATLPARPAKIYSLVFLNDDQLATGGSDNAIRLWNLSSKMATDLLVGHTGTVATLACDAAGETLVSGGYDTTVRVWNLRGGERNNTAAATPDTKTR